MFPEYVEMQKLFYEHHKANVQYHIHPHFKHWFNDKTVPKDMADYLYQNMGASGFSASNPLKDGDPNWRENGYFGKFKQK